MDKKIFVLILFCLNFGNAYTCLDIYWSFLEGVGLMDNDIIKNKLSRKLMCSIDEEKVEKKCVEKFYENERLSYRITDERYFVRYYYDSLSYYFDEKNNDSLYQKILINEESNNDTLIFSTFIEESDGTKWHSERKIYENYFFEKTLVNRSSGLLGSLYERVFIKEEKKIIANINTNGNRYTLYITMDDSGLKCQMPDKISEDKDFLIEMEPFENGCYFNYFRIDDNDTTFQNGYLIKFINEQPALIKENKVPMYINSYEIKKFDLLGRRRFVK